MKRIVIVGAGAGGLPLAGWLGERYRNSLDVSVTLVDKSLSHVWKPLLHEYAVGTLTSNDDEINLFAHSQQHGYEFVFGEMNGLDQQSKTICLSRFSDAAGEEVLPERSLDYDILVLAVGSTCNDFGVEGVREHAIMLDDKVAAERFHQEFIHYLLRGEATQREPQGKASNIVIVGAGATGVELAAQIQEVITDAKRFGLRHYDRDNTRVILLEAMTRCVPGLSDKISQRVAATLKRVGIDLRTGQQVARLTEKQVEIRDADPIDADLIVWAAGISGHPWLDQLGLPVNERHQLRAHQTLQSTGDENIFVMGDCASIEYDIDGEHTVVPALAQAAFQQAEFLRRAIPEFLESGEIRRQYAFTHRGSLITVARHDAAGTIMGKYIQSLGLYGLTARLAYLSLYRRHQLSVLGIWQTGIALLKNALRTTPGSKLKLH